MIKLLFDLLNKIFDRVLSARFLITLAVGFTYCHVVWHAVHFYLKAMISDPKQMEAFATGLIMGFTGIASFIFKAYFDRADRAAAPDPNALPKPPAPVMAAPTSPKATDGTAGKALLEFLLLIACVFMVGCALRYHETTFVQGVNVYSPEYGKFDNVTVNHEGNFYIGIDDAKNIRSANN